MARKTVVELIDDLDGTPADETVEFALDEVGYAIDLSAAHAARLRDALAVYVGHARRATARRPRATEPPPAPAPSPVPSPVTEPEVAEPVADAVAEPVAEPVAETVAPVAKQDEPVVEQSAPVTETPAPQPKPLRTVPPAGVTAEPAAAPLRIAPGVSALVVNFQEARH